MHCFVAVHQQSRDATPILPNITVPTFRPIPKSKPTRFSDSRRILVSRAHCMDFSIANVAQRIAWLLPASSSNGKIASTASPMKSRTSPPARWATTPVKWEIWSSNIFSEVNRVVNSIADWRCCQCRQSERIHKMILWTAHINIAYRQSNILMCQDF